MPFPCLYNCSVCSILQQLSVCMTAKKPHYSYTDRDKDISSLIKTVGLNPKVNILTVWWRPKNWIFLGSCKIYLVENFQNRNSRATIKMSCDIFLLTYWTISQFCLKLFLFEVCKIESKNILQGMCFEGTAWNTKIWPYIEVLYSTVLVLSDTQMLSYLR